VVGETDRGLGSDDAHPLQAAIDGLYLSRQTEPDGARPQHQEIVVWRQVLRDRGHEATEVLEPMRRPGALWWPGTSASDAWITACTASRTMMRRNIRLIPFEGDLPVVPSCNDGRTCVDPDNG
jgi:hypothetical protein